MTAQDSSPQHAEAERKKNDLHKVYNPTSQGHKVRFNMAVAPQIWTIKAHSEEIVPLFVCIKYLREMSTKIIYTKSDSKTKKENLRRQKAGLQPMRLYDERFRYESLSLKITKDQYVKMMAQLYRGLYKEYGIEAEPEASPVAPGPSKPAFESALDEIFEGKHEKEVVETPNPTSKAGKPKVEVEKSDMKAKIDAEMKKVSKKKEDEK